MQLGSLTRTLLCGTTLLATSTPLRAEQVTQLDVITVTVNKIRQVLSQVAGGVSVETKKEKDLYGQQTVQQIVAGMPGVSASQGATDPAQAINIRGLQDFGRVAVTIDGARQNYQRTGHNANGMFYFDPEQMQQVTVTRGPIANVYGSGAIGGVVSFDTLDALSFLKPGESMAAQEKLAYTTNGNKLLSSTTGALRYGDYGGFLGNIVFRNANDYVDGNGNGVGSSGSNIKDGLGKLTLTPGDEVRIDLGYLINNDTFHTPAISPSTTQYDNTVNAQTASAKFNYKPKSNELVDFTASSYWTGTNQSQYVTNGSAANLGKTRRFNIDTIGSDLYNTSRFALGSTKNALTAGADVFQDNVNVTDPTSAGASTYTPSGQRSAGGAFVQDKIDVAKWLEFDVAGRFDFYQASGKGTSTNGNHFSPKGTVVLKPFEDTGLHGLNFYGTYAEGYRAPALTESLIAGVHPGFPPFNFIPNPSLRPEVGHTMEVGFTGKFDDVLRAEDSVTVRGSVYQNMVDDYIDPIYTDPNGDTNFVTFANSGDDTYQYINIQRARLRGIEAEFNYDSPVLFGGVAASAVRGNNDVTGAYLISVPADKVVTTLGFHFDERKGSIGARWFAVSGQTLVPTSTNAVTSPPKSDPYNLVNLFFSYNLNNNLSVGLNADNIFNTYYRPYLDSNYAAGRSVMLTVTTRLGK